MFQLDCRIWGQLSSSMVLLIRCVNAVLLNWKAHSVLAGNFLIILSHVNGSRFWCLRAEYSYWLWITGLSLSLTDILVAKVRSLTLYHNYSVRDGLIKKWLLFVEVKEANGEAHLAYKEYCSSKILSTLFSNNYGQGN